MKVAGFFALLAAIVLHGGFILFGGLLLPKAKEDHGTLQEVDLLHEEEAEAEKKKEKPEERPADAKEEEMEAEDEPPPDSAELLRSLELSPVADAPALDAASLGAIELALAGQGGGGDFGEALSFSSGGRIGGLGKPGALEESLEKVFTLAEIDQKPRPLFQAAPLYPAEMRGKKVEGIVTVIFVVDASGRVAGPRVEASTHPAFDKPAVEAVRRWKFEPAVKAGQRVKCNMRVPIRFQPS